MNRGNANVNINIKPRHGHFNKYGWIFVIVMFLLGLLVSYLLFGTGENEKPNDEETTIAESENLIE